MTMRTLYDSVTVAALPPGGDLYAGYLDGRYANYAAVVARFPGHKVVSIAAFPGTRGADVYDTEPGDLTPSDVPPVLIRERGDGRDPSVYSSVSEWPRVLDACDIAGVAPPPWWAADWTHAPHLVPGSVATQWESTPGYDVSEVADYWPGVDAMPVTPEYDPPIVFDGALVASQLVSVIPFGIRHLTTTGAVYNVGVTPPYPPPVGANGQPWFAGRTAARLDWPTGPEAAAGKVFAIIATSGERYAFPV